jgi:hypothetical protein
MLERGMGHTEEALELAGRAVTEEPRFVRGWLFVARLEADRGRLAEAREAVERALEARRLARWRPLSAYERDLVELPAWQLEQLERELGPRE